MSAPPKLKRKAEEDLPTTTTTPSAATAATAATAAATATTASAKKPKVNASITSFFSVPALSSPTTVVADDGDGGDGGDDAKTVSASEVPNAATPTPTPTPATPAFNRAKWVAGLSAEVRSLLAVEIAHLEEGWLAALKEEIVSEGFLELKRFLKREKLAGKTVYPPENEVYGWSKYTPLNTVKAVIVGQDPYINVNQAHGLCFSVRRGVAPPSLKNVFIALAKDYPDFKPPPNNGGLLVPWAKQGVLLLNTVLTVRAKESNSHAKKGWEKFTQKVIDIVAKKRTRGVVFLVWGTPARSRVTRIDKSRHCILESVHPSPLSAARGFFDCGHFKKTNEWLKQRYGEEGVIDWNLNVPA